MIQQESKTDWQEMYRVFNMGHRLEIYTDASSAERMMAMARMLHIDAKIIGHVEGAPSKKLTIQSEHGTFVYES